MQPMCRGDKTKQETEKPVGKKINISEDIKEKHLVWKKIPY